MSAALSKIGVFTCHIESYQCDFNEKARLVGIVNQLLDAAIEHAEERGFGYTALKNDNRAWVLSRLIIEINEHPKNETDLTISTWIEGVTRTFTNRCFMLSDKEGNAIGYARSVWAAIDRESRKPVNILDWRPDMNDYIEKDADCPIDNPSKIPMIQENVCSSFTVKYSDIDINGHVNSMRHIEHLIDSFDLSYFQKKSISKFEIIYLTESAFGDELTIHKQEISPDEFLLEIKKGETSVCRSRLFWK